jgi:hypothetical protein
MHILIKFEADSFYEYKPIIARNFELISNQFLKNTLIALDYLFFNHVMTVVYNKNTEFEKIVDIIETLVNLTPEPIIIEKGETNQYFPLTNTVKFNDENGVMFRKDFKQPFKCSNIGFNSPVSLLAHELVHCYHELFDENGYKSRKNDFTSSTEKIAENGTNLSFPNEEEELVIRLTNQICEKLGEDKRGNYGRNYYLTETVLSTNKLKNS